MKKIILPFAICFSTLAVFGQGNLQFVQAKLISAIDTVPAGKVWKVEGVIYSIDPATTIVAYGNEVTDKIQLNGSFVTIRKSSYSGSSYGAGSSIWEQKFPLWMPAGTTLAASNGVLYINILEFNEVP